MDATAAMELTLFKMHTASSENNDLDVPGPWAWDVRTPRESIFKALQRQSCNKPSIGVRIVGDVDGTVSREYVRDSKIWTRYYHGYRREADAVWIGRRHMALTTAGGSSGSAAGGSSKKSKRAVTVSAKAPKKAGQMLQAGVDMLRKVSSPEALAAAEDAEAAAGSSSTSSSSKDPLADPKLMWVDLPCIAANSPDAADDDDDDTSHVNQSGTPLSAKTTQRTTPRAMDAQPLTAPLALGPAPRLRVNTTLWKTVKDVDAAAHTLYNAAPSGTLMVVVCQGSLVKLQTLLAQRQKSKWSQKASADNTGVAGGSKERHWTQDDEQELALEADIAMSGVSFLAFKP
jgi:hypothetical protein